MSAGRTQKTANMKCATKLGGKPRKRRLKWLGSGSVLAAAIAVAAAVSSPLAAQSVPSMPRSGGGALDSAGPMLPGNPILGIKGGPEQVAPMRAAVQSVPAPIATKPYIDAKGITLDAPRLPDSQPELPDAHAPHGSQRTGSAGTTNVPVAAIQAPASSTPAPSPGDTDTNGINVLASANYFASEVDYRPGVASDVVELFGSEAIINWTTFTAGSAGNEVTFLGAGSSLEFTSALTDYTVLNRIFTPGIDSAIRIDGSVTSTVAGGVTGGNVWFYSPGGIVIGSTGSFDVGSLVLTSSALNAINDGDLVFSGVAEPNTSVVIEDGATINATNQGSYVAILAPRVEQAGTVNVNGSVAYVGAEQAQLTINNGLFDITIGVGTADANGVVHTGTTTGAASQATVDPTTGAVLDADAQAIYMVSVAKNDAINMLVGGDIGYQAASAASVTDNGTIILSAGANVSVEGGFNSPTIAIDTDNATAGGNISLTDATLTSDTEVYASGTADLTQSGVNTGLNGYNRLAMGSDGRGDYALTVNAGEAINFGVANYGVIDIAGDITLSGSGDAENPTNITVDVTSPTKKPPLSDQIVPIPADGGSITVGGNLTIDTSARGNDDFFTVRNNGNTGIGQNAVAGDISVSVSGAGLLTVGGNVVLDASAQGGKGESQNGTATGGNVTFSNLGGTVDITGGLSLNSRAIRSSDGKIGGNGPGLIGANSTAGDISVVLDGDIGTGGSNVGSLSLNASAAASSGSDRNTAQTNTGTAGDVSISVLGGTHQFANLDIFAQARGASSYTADGTLTGGGAVLGGLDISVSGERSLLDIAGDLSIDAASNGILLAGTPSALNISLTDTNFDLLGPVQSGGLTVGDDIFIDLQVSDASNTALNTSRSVNITVDNSNLSMDTMFVSNEASPGGFAFSTVGDGTDFQAGDITLTARNGAEISGRSLFLTASATGNDVFGGNGTGGNINLLADNATIAFTGTTSLNSSGQGGASQDVSGTSGTGRGGTVRLQVTGTDGALNLNTVRARANGTVFLDVEGGGGGAGIVGDGGNGIAGSVIFDIDGGVLTAGNVSVTADGEGGEGGSVGSGSGSGPRSLGDPGLLAMLDPDALASGLGAPGFGDITALTLGAPSGLPKGGKGGDGVGGTVTFNVNGGSATMSNLTVSATGEGGEGAFGSLSLGFTGGDGGDATGGTATFNAIAGSLTVTNTLEVSANANTDSPFAFGNGNGGNGSGVEGGDAGSATAGDAVFNLDGTATITAADVVVSANAFGGRGGDSFATFFGGVPTNAEAAGAGGNATAGDAVFNNTAGTLTFNSLTVSASGTGGEGGGNFGLSTGESDDVGGAGGSGTGGNATINLNQDDTGSAVYIIEAIGTGGAGGGGLDSGAGGLGQGGTARLNVNDVAVNLGNATLTATATGGDAGFVDGEGGNGGAGGNAIGGTTIIDVNGVNAVLTSDNAFRTDVSAQGGAGADGNSPIFGGTAPGNGGAGGSGTAGLIQIVARDGATATYQTDSSTAAVGRGGDGGDGGSDFTGTGTGDGGAAGAATGGRIEILAQTGATLNMTPLSTSVDLDVSAFGANGGNAGTNSFGGAGLVGANGDAAAGSILVSADGAGTLLSFTGDLNATANATATTDFRTGAMGGNATGGDFEVTVANGATLVANAGLGLRSTAIGGTASGVAGNATGADATISLTGGTLLGSAITVDLQTLGGTARPNNSGAGGDGADGGAATGGTISVSVDDSSDLSVASLFLTTNSLGGNGGQAGFSGGTSGGAGGAATGSDITVDLQGDATGLGFVQMLSSATGGAGGAGRDGAAGGQGGAAVGGDLVFDIDGTGPALAVLASVNLFGDAAGGAGGAGGEGDDLIASGSGGSGGAATGGSATFALSGNGATLTFDPAIIQLSANGSGGSGGAGGNNGSGGVTGNGGAGGAGTGGAVVLQANSAATLDLTNGGSFTLSSDGTGGAGGIGGDAFLSGGPGGNGGAGGTGTGGSPTLRAVGGTINGNALQLTATGTGGAGGSGGDDGNATFGATGAGGNGVGGTPTIETLDGSPGIIAFGNVTLDATGQGGTGSATGTALGGHVIITDGSDDPAGLISFNNLTVNATGDIATPGAMSLSVTGGTGAISVANDFVVNAAGDIDFTFDGDEQLSAGRDIILATSGNVAVTHTNNSNEISSLLAGRDISGTVVGDFSAATGTILNAAREVSISATNITFDTIAANGENVFDAGEFGLTLNAVGGSVTGSPTGSLVSRSGVDIDATQAISFGDLAVNDGPIRIDAGTTLTTGDISIATGGFASNESIIMNAGSDTILGNVAARDGLTVTSGGNLTALSLRGTGINATATGAVDIGNATIFSGVAGGGGITISGTSIILDSADASTSVGNDIVLDATAGDLVLGTINTEAFLDATATGDITFDRLTGTGVFLTSGGNVTGNFASSDRAVNTGRPRDVIITATGDVSVRAFETVNDVEVTAASFTSGSITTGTGVGGVASDVLVNVTGLADIGSTDVQGIIDIDAGTITLGNVVVLGATLLDSTTGDISIGTIAADSSVVANSAAGLTLGSSLKTGSDTFGNESMTFTAAGDLAVTGTIDSHDRITLSAGGALGANQLVARDSISVTVGGDVTIASLTTTVGGTGNLASVTGQSVTVTNGDLIGDFQANATGGDIALGTLTANGVVDLDATGNMNLANVTGGRLLLTTLTGSGIQIDAGGAVTFGDLATTDGSIALTAGGGVSGANMSASTNGVDGGADSAIIAAGGDVTLTGTVTALDAITITTPGLVDANILTASDALTVTATGTVNVTNASTLTADPAAISGSTVTLDGGSFAGALNVTSTAGNVVFGGDVVAGLASSISSAQDFLFTNLSTDNGNLNVTTTRNISGGALRAATLGLDGGSDSLVIDAGGSLTLTGTSTALDGITITTGGDVTVDTLEASDALTVNGGVVSIASAATLTNDPASITGSEVVLGSGQFAGTVSVTSTTGDVTLASDVTGTSNITVTSARDISFGTISTSNGTLSLNAARDASGTSLFHTAIRGSGGPDNITVTTGNNFSFSGIVQNDDDNITIRAGGALLGGELRSGLLMTLEGDTIDVDAINSGSILTATTTGGDLVTGDVTSGANVNFNSARDIVTGDITAVGLGSTLTAIANITIDTITTTGTVADIFVNAGGGFDFAGISGSRLVRVIAGAVTGGDATGAQVDFQGTSIDVGALDATNGFVVLDSTVGDISLVSAAATFGINITSAANVVAGDLTATGITVNAPGSVTLGDALSTSSMTLDVGGNLTTGQLEARSTSPGLIATVRGDASIAGADSNGLLTLNVTGALAGGALSSASVVNLSAATLDVDSVQSRDQSVTVTATAGNAVIDTVSSRFASTVTATGDVIVDTLTTGTSSTLRGANVTLNNGDITGNLTLDATAGNISGTGTINVSVGIDLDATGDIAFGSLAAGTTFFADAGGTIAFASASSGSGLAFDADIIDGGNVASGSTIAITGSSVELGTLSSALGTNITAGSITIDTVNNGTTADITLVSTGATSVNDLTARIATITAGTDITLGTVNAEGRDIRGIALALDAGGTLDYGSIVAGRGVNIDATVVTGGNLTADDGVDILADSINVGDVAVLQTGALRLESTVGDLVAGDLSNTTFGIVAVSAADLTVGNSVVSGTANASDISFTAIGNAMIGDATAGNQLAITVGGNLAAGNLTSNVVSPGTAVSVGGDADITSFDAVLGTGLIDVGGALTGGDFAAASVLTIEADSIDIGSATSGTQRISITANALDITVGTIDSALGTTLTAVRNITVDHAEAGTDFTATGGGDFATSLNSIITGGDIIINMGGTVDLGNSTAGGLIDVQGAQIDFASLTSGSTVDLTTAGAIGGGDIDADGDIMLDAGTMVLGDVVTLTNVTANAAGGDATFNAITAGNNITIVASGVPTIGTINVGNNLSITGSSVTLGAGNIAGQLLLQATAGDVLLSLDGAEQIIVGGPAILNASNDIIVTHTNNAGGVISLDSANSISFSANGAIDAQAGSILSGNEVFLLASGQINVDDVRAIPGMLIQGGGSVVVNNASATGPQGLSNFRGITIEAGLDPFGGIFYDNLSNVTITGTVDSYADVTVRAGGQAVFATGSSTVANDRVFVETGDDIIVQAGATLTSARTPSAAPDPLNPFNGTAAIELQAGGLTNLLSVPATPIASLVVDGTLDANSSAIIASANAIDGLDGTFDASSIQLDINDAPGVGGTQSDDAGLLSADCVEGNICLGNILADNVVSIGQNSNNDVIQLIIEEGSVNANDILITTRNDIVMGSNGIATTLNASNSFSATSISGDVNLFDANITSNQILINAAGSLLGSAVLNSTNDIGITVGQNLTAASITTGGELTQVASVGGALEGFYSVNGSMDIGTLSVGAGNVNLSANNDIVIDSIIVPGTDISLAAGGLAELGFTNTATNVSLDGNAVIFGTINASGDVGADSGSTIDITSITAGNNIDLLAVDAVTGGDLTATGSLTVEGGLIAINNATANQIDLISDTDILFNLLQSTSDLILTANNGRIANNGGTGDIQSGGGVDLTAIEITIGDITANGDVAATSTNGSMLVGAITNNAFGSSINLSAAGATSDVTTDALRTNEGDILISAARDIALANAATSIGTPIGGNIGLLAGRDVAVAGILSAGEDVSVRALGAATLTDIIAGDDVVINAVAAVNLVSATTFDTGADDAGLTFVDANAGQPGSIGFGTENLPGSNIDIRSDAGVAVTGTLDSSGNIDVIGAGDVIIQEAISVGGTSLNGANVALVDGAITGGLAIDAAVGTIDVTGGVTVGGTITFDAATDVAFGDLRSDNGEFDIVAGGDITFGNAGAADNLAFDAGGTIAGGNLDSGNFLTLDGGDIAVANVTGPFVGMVSASDILFDTINATNRVELTATNGSVAANMGAANVTSGGDIVVIANAIDVGDLTAAGVLSLDGGSVALGAGDANSIAITSGSDILFNSLVSPNAITLSALNGRIGTNGGSGDIDSDDDVDLTAQEIAIGDVAAGGSVTASATDGNAALGNITATSNVTVAAAGTAIVADVASGGDTSITGTTVGLGTGTVGGDLFLTATAGDLTGIGVVTVAGGIALSASGDVGFGSLEAQGGAFTVDAGGDIIFDTLTSADLARLDAGGLIDGNRIDADTAITLTANSSIDIDHAEAGTDFTATAGGNFTTGLNSIITGGDIVVAGDIVNLGNSTAGGLIQVTGTQIDFVNLVAGSTIDLLTDFNTPQGITGSGNLNITGVNITAGSGASSLDSLGDITITGDTIIGGSLTMGADGDISFVTADVQGGDFEAAAGGDIAFTTATANGAIDFLAGGSIAGGGDVAAGRTVDLVADAGSVTANDVLGAGDITIGAGTTVAINDVFSDSSDLSITAGGDIDLRDTDGTVNVVINSGGALTYRDIDAGLIADLDAVGDVTGTSITAGDVIDVRSSGGGAVTADDFSSNRNIGVTTTGQVTVANVAAALGGTGDVTITGGAGIDIETLSAIAATLNSANGSIIVDGNAAIQNLLTANGVDVFLRSDTDMQVLTEATGGTIDIAVDGNLDVQGATAPGDITLVSGGFTAINAPVGGNASTPPGFQGTQQVTTTNGGNVSITAGTDIVINSTVSAAGNLLMDAGGLIDIQATASGVQIDTLSADMNIGTAGALGRSDQTNAITIETIGDIQLGGAAGTSTGFEIDADEFTRIFSGGDLSLVATGLTTGEGNITVDDLVVTAAAGTGGPTDGNIATFGSFILEADNDVSFLGDFTLTNATADSVFIVDAINQIFIDAEEATVRIEDNAGAISGNIDMSAGSIIAATSALLADLPNLSFADAEAAAGQAAATPRPDGYIFGSEISFAVDSLLLIQNSAAGTDFADRRGITADTLSIFERTPGIGIAINGIVGGNTGVDAIAVTTVPTTFEPLSTINGCLIADPSSCIVVVTPPNPGPTPGPNSNPADIPLSDLIDDQIDPESPVESGSIVSMIVEFRDDPERQTDPLIDEPVTGAGNEDLWIGDEEDCDPADPVCELEPAE